MQVIEKGQLRLPLFVFSAMFLINIHRRIFKKLNH
jgi:hypothetical protein